MVGAFITSAPRRRVHAWRISILWVCHEFSEAASVVSFLFPSHRKLPCESDTICTILTNDGASPTLRARSSCVMISGRRGSGWARPARLLSTYVEVRTAYARDSEARVSRDIAGWAPTKSWGPISYYLLLRTVQPGENRRSRATLDEMRLCTIINDDRAVCGIRDVVLGQCESRDHTFTCFL